MKSENKITESPSRIQHRGSFDLIRLVLALAVIFSHSIPMYLENESGSLNYFRQALGGFAVAGFFIISGFLVYESWLRDPRMHTFFIRRALRIYPGFFLSIVGVAFIGFFFSTLTLQQYVMDPVFKEFFRNLFFDLRYALPTVLHGRDVHGSIWTIPIEVSCYVCLPVLAMFVRRFGNFWLAVMMIVLHCFALRLPEPKDQFIAGMAVCHLFANLTFFISGILYYRWVGWRPIPRWIVLSACLLLLSFYNLNLWLSTRLVLFPVIVLGITTRPIQLSKILQQKIGDISYGTYLWGFFIQQVILATFPNVSFIVFLGGSFLISMFCGYLSWRFAEEPMLRWKPANRVL